MNGLYDLRFIYAPLECLTITKVPEKMPEQRPPRSCPAVLISAPASGQGKTTLTAGLARYHRNQGRKVRVFKTGPDFLDPMILEQAAGVPVYQLDLWMIGERACKNLLYQAAEEADLILIEGVMGLFDGTPSSADLAVVFGVPTVIVINAGAMAQTFGALAYGLANYRPGLPVAGFVANGVASSRHRQLLATSLPEGMNLLGTLPHDSAATLPNRHLGLVQAREVQDLEERLEASATAITATALSTLPGKVMFGHTPMASPPPLLQGVKIGIARDTAFAFLYPANLDLLRCLGAELVFFSPLQDNGLPPIDSLYLPGGYPELHLQALAANVSMKTAVQQHHRAGKPIYAECGGMLYLLQTLTDKAGQTAPMVGLLPGHGIMLPRLAALGMQSAPLPKGELRGHTFHHSRLEITAEPFAHGHRPDDARPGEAIYRIERLTASYLHLYFATHARATAELFRPF